jgi:hypothetical protein
VATYNIGTDGRTVVVSYESEILNTGVSAAENFIERERSCSRSGWALTEAILYRGPTPHFWESVHALQRMAAEWAVYRVIVEGMRYGGAEPRTSKWLYPMSPETLLIPYPTLEDLGSLQYEERGTQESILTVPEPEILTSMYAEDTRRASSAGLSMMFDYFLNLQAQRQIGEINHILERAEVAQLAPELLVGLLRINFPERNLLNEWDVYLTKVESELSMRRIPDIPRILQGLRR